MEFNKETVNKIAQNAKTAQETWGDFSHDKKLCECFHLRPTASGIAIISILHFAPMRGITIKPNKLKDVLTEIAVKTDVLLGIDIEKSLKLMENWGFKNREIKNKKSEGL